MSSSRPILIALVLGAFTGLFLGERAAFLDVVADGYIRLLQMTVLPFIVVSLISGIGRLTHKQALLLARTLGVVLASLWALALTLVFLFPLMLPRRISASFFSSTLVEPSPKFDLLAQYVPANPFNSLANTVVPAVVFFSVVIGVALIAVPDKTRLLEVLDVFRAAVSRAARFVLRLVPLGLFAIVATTAGTITMEQLLRLQAYLIAYGVLAMLLGLWVLPGLVSALTGVRYRSLVAAYRDPLVTAFVTSDLFVVLPTLTERTRDLVRAHGLDRYEAAPDVIIPASFNFPHSGKVLTLTFVLFAGWLSDAAIPPERYAALGGTGLLAMFGSVNVAMPFLLDLFRVPADTFQLFVATGFLNGRFGSMLAASHTVTVALLGTWAVSGALRGRGPGVVRFAMVTVLLAIGTVGGTRLLVTQLSGAGYSGDAAVMNLDLRYPSRPAASPHHQAAIAVTDPALDRIRKGGTLRVGYIPDSVPFAYTNARGALVGFDVDMANRLAGELGVAVAFMPLWGIDTTGNKPCACDVVMSGVAVTTDRAASLLLSPSYLDETLAFVVPDGRRAEFAEWTDIRRRPHLRLGLPNLPHVVNAARAALPQAEIVTFPTARALFATSWAGIDAAVITAERGSAWTLWYPQFSVVVPAPTRIRVPLAYVVPSRDEGFAAFLGTWIDLKRKDGTIQTLYDHWILGRSGADAAPRWSIVRDVLHWVE